MKIEIKNKETLNYLEKIFSGQGHIFNPMKINIPGFGEVIATSMVNRRTFYPSVVDYFTFKRGSEKGEFFKEDGGYFMEKK